MGKLLKQLSLFLVLFLFVTSLKGEGMDRPLFTPVEVGFRLMNPPRIKAGSVSSASRGSVVLSNRRWGVIELSYRPSFTNEGRSSRKKKVAAGYWLDDVICGIRVIVCDRQNRRAPVLALFSTRVEFWTISLDSRDHKYFVYIPPMLIERTMPPRKNDSRMVKIASDNDFIVGVTFFHKKWGVLGEGFYGLKGRHAAEDFRELLKMIPRNSTFHGSLLSRANSPWGVNDQSQFDLEKPAFIPAPLDEAAIDKAAASAAAEEAAFAERTRKSSKSANEKKSKRSRK